MSSSRTSQFMFSSSTFSLSKWLNAPNSRFVNASAKTFSSSETNRSLGASLQTGYFVDKPFLTMKAFPLLSVNASAMISALPSLPFIHSFKATIVAMSSSAAMTLLSGVPAQPRCTDLCHLHGKPPACLRVTGFLNPATYPGSILGGLVLTFSSPSNLQRLGNPVQEEQHRPGQDHLPFVSLDG